MHTIMTIAVVVGLGVVFVMWGTVNATRELGVRRKFALDTLKINYIKVILNHAALDPVGCLEHIERQIQKYSFSPQELGVDTRTLVEHATITAKLCWELSKVDLQQCNTDLDNLRWGSNPDMPIEEWKKQVKVCIAHVEACGTQEIVTRSNLSALLSRQERSAHLPGNDTTSRNAVLQPKLVT